MKTRKTISFLGLLLAFAIILPAARADEYDQASQLTFSQPVQIPGHVLPAGTYWFVLADVSIANRNIIHIFNSDRSTLLASILTIDAQRLKTTDHTAMTFAERGAMQPATVLSWFYPGRTPGHQFVYSNMEQQELAQVKHYTIMVKSQNKHQTAVAGD